MSQPLPAVLPIEGESPDLACSSVVEAPDVVCASPRLSRHAFARRRPTRVMETPVRIAPRLTIQDPLAAAGAGGLFPTIPLTPCLATASRHGGELDAVGGYSEVPDLSRVIFRVRHTTGSSAFRRLSAVAAGHPGASISDDILRCGDRWT